MGIRFFCPNGHRLHVKTFLAGKRGICPDCGMGVDIPLTSDPVAMKKGKEVDLNAPTIGGQPDDDPEIPLPPSVRGGAATPVSGVRMPVNIPSGVFAEIPKSAPFGTQTSTAVAPVQPIASPMPASQPTMASATQLVAQSMPVSQPATAVIPMGNVARGTAVAVAPAPMPVPAMMPQIDPILEAPQAIWYVRPPTGGQYGPARGDMMRSWVSEGRVSADSLVWREGWPDWRAASKVFPNLGAGLEGGFQSPVMEESGGNRIVRPVRKNSSMSVAIVVMLTLVAISLGVALFFVLNNAK
jgi:hypothetical protein